MSNIFKGAGLFAAGFAIGYVCDWIRNKIKHPLGTVKAPKFVPLDEEL